MKALNKIWPFVVSGVAWLALDMLTKTLAAAGAFQNWVVVPRFFYFTLQKNAGIAFGIPLMRGPQIVISFLIIGVLLTFGTSHFLQKKQFLIQSLFGIIIGGAVGNLIDRIARGDVVDFIVLRPFPVFNIADVGITVGLIALFLLTLKKTND